jgi:hypothetical protein
LLKSPLILTALNGTTRFQIASAVPMLTRYTSVAKESREAQHGWCKPEVVDHLEGGDCE